MVRKKGRKYFGFSLSQLELKHNKLSIHLNKMVQKNLVARKRFWIQPFSALTKAQQTLDIFLKSDPKTSKQGRGYGFNRFATAV
jgi:hypothetical protein